METKLNKLTAIILIAAFSFFWILPPSSAQAAWEDKSDELPGMTSGATIALITVGCVAVIATVILLSKHAKKNKPDENEKETAKSDSTHSQMLFNELNNYSSTHSQQYLPRLQPCFDINFDKSNKMPALNNNAFKNSNMVIKVGIAYKF